MTNMYQYRDILILTTFLTNLASLFAAQPTQQPQRTTFHDKVAFFKNRKPSIELSDLIAIIQATTSLKDAAQALDVTKKRVLEKITPTVAVSWLNTLDQTYSDHVASHIVFDYEHTQKTVNDLFAMYRTMESQLIAIQLEMTKLSDEQKSDQLDLMFDILQRGKNLEAFLTENLVPQTPITQTWEAMSNTMTTVAATAKKTLDMYIPRKASPAVQAEFNRQIEVLRSTRTLKTALKALLITQQWIADRLAAGDITPLESATWNGIASTTYDDQINKSLPQLQIAQIYARSKQMLKVLPLPQ